MAARGGQHLASPCWIYTTLPHLHPRINAASMLSVSKHVIHCWLRRNWCIPAPSYVPATQEVPTARNLEAHLRLPQEPGG